MRKRCQLINVDVDVDVDGKCECHNFDNYIYNIARALVLSKSY